MSMPTVLSSATFPAVAQSAREARNFAGKVLGSFFGADDERTDDAILSISEAVANSAEHSGSRFGGKVTVTLIDIGSGQARAEITDDGAATVPTLHTVGETATSGRGISLIQALTQRSGHFTDDEGRLTFWFEL